MEFAVDTKWSRYMSACLENGLIRGTNNIKEENNLEIMKIKGKEI